MTKYLVHLHPGNSKVVISLDGYGPTPGEGLKEIGSFEHDIDPNDAQFRDPEDVNQNGDHPFVVEARKILQDHLGEHVRTKHFTFVDRATNAVPDQNDDADFSTDAIRVTDGGGDAEASTQAGGIKNARTGEVHRDVQEAGEQPESPPATQAVTGQTGNGGETGEGESGSQDGETVAQLKERIASITDKAELEAIYKAEQAKGDKARSSALAAIEARAAELEA